jgi:hypothetical protein
MRSENERLFIAEKTGSLLTRATQTETPNDAHQQSYFLVKVPMTVHNTLGRRSRCIYLARVRGRTATDLIDSTQRRCAEVCFGLLYESKKDALRKVASEDPGGARFGSEHASRSTGYEYVQRQTFVARRDVVYRRFRDREIPALPVGMDA